MKIAIILPELLPVPPVNGGAVEQWVHTVSRGLVAAGVDLTIVSRPAGVAGEAEVDYVGIPWTKFSAWVNAQKGQLSKKNPLRILAKIQNVWSYGRQLAGVTDAHDVVCIQNDPNLLFFIRKRKGQRLVLHMHNEHLGISFLRPFYRRALAKTDLVVCVSDYIRSRAIAVFPEYADKFVVLLNAVDAEFFHPMDKAVAREQTNLPREVAADRIVLYVGRVTPEKGVHVLLAAFEPVSRRVPGARLVAVGSSFFGGAAKTAYQRDLSKSAEHFGERVYFTGFLPQERVRDLYAAADVIVAPAIWQEPCALVVLEAMASGTPLVATTTGGTPELVRGSETGLLVPPGDAEALAEAIVSILENPDLAAAMGAEARAYVREHHSWPDLVSKFRNLLEGTP